MKPAPFKYAAPETLESAISLLVEYGDEAKILAGGQSLIPMLNMRLARPGVLVDINRIAGLETIEANGELRLGTLARHAAVLRSHIVHKHAPSLANALVHVGHVGIRTRGTIGGSIAHADPAAELPTVLLAHEGSVVAQGPEGERIIAADDLFVTNFTTTLGEEEVLTQVRIPARGDDVHSSFREVARRRGDFALVLVAVVAETERDLVKRARIALGSVADRPVRAIAAEECLQGKSLEDPAVLTEVGRLVSDQLDPPGDVHATSDYRRAVAAILVTRALADIAEERR